MKISKRVERNLYYAVAIATGVLLFTTPVHGQNAEKRSLSPEAQDRIINLTSNVALRLSAATGRYGDIIARMESRIAKLKLAGVDTSRAEIKVAEARQRLSDTIVLQDTLGSVRAAVGSDTPRESFAQVRSQISIIKESLRSVHTILRETLALLKEAVRNSELPGGMSDTTRNNE